MTEYYTMTVKPANWSTIREIHKDLKAERREISADLITYVAEKYNSEDRKSDRYGSSWKVYENPDKIKAEVILLAATRKSIIKNLPKVNAIKQNDRTVLRMTKFSKIATQKRREATIKRFLVRNNILPVEILKPTGALIYNRSAVKKVREHLNDPKIVKQLEMTRLTDDDLFFEEK